MSHSRVACVVHEQGKRESQEDATDHQIDPKTGWAVFVLMDGHGGREVVDFATDRKTGIATFVLSQLAASHFETYDDVTAFLERCIPAYDRRMYYAFWKQTSRIVPVRSGSTLVMVVIDPTEQHIWIVNLGDSRAVIYDPVHNRVVTTVDQTVEDPAERKRVEEHGGKAVKHNTYVSPWYQPTSALGMSRSLGDYAWKIIRSNNDPDYLSALEHANKTGLVTDHKKATAVLTSGPLRPTSRLRMSVTQSSVISIPSVQYRAITTKQPLFIALFCDGISSVMSYDAMWHKWISKWRQEPPTADTCSMWVHYALHDLKSSDNVSAMIITLAAQQTYKEE